ncbi:choice-of-anchor A family protein [Catellatospora sp. NPDC049111]|uniref:choice-of-anchor A family protein n=1 Tax=Catellatospora sp. NPDC049111 TaxID=3155271 RepID=UPI0033E3EA9C
MRGIVAATALLSATASAMLVMLPATPARAVSPANPTAAALGFNVFVQGNATLTSNESEGPVALGGNLTLGGDYQVAGNASGSYIAPGDAVRSTLVIGGAVNFTDSNPGAILQVQNQTYAKLGNPAGADVRNTTNTGDPTNTVIVAEGAAYNSEPRVQLSTIQPVDSVLRASGINFATAFADFRSSSADLAGCTNNIILRNANNEALPDPLPPNTNAFITLAPNVTNVLNITAANLANVSAFTFVNQPSATQPLLVNVNTGPGDTFNWTVPNQAGIGGANAPFLLWNFPTATALTLATNGATLEGTLYAPRAALTDLSSSNVEGQVIVASLVHGTSAANGGEMHYFPFAARLGCVVNPTPDLTTEASADIALGGQVHDVATLAGGVNPTGTITFDLYGPDDTTCTGTPVHSATVVVQGDSTYTSDDFTPTQTGTYRWIARYSGDGRNLGVVTACSDEAEWVVVGPAVVTPMLATLASPNIALGGRIRDNATLTGGQNPTGTITFSLYGPDNALCLGTPVFTDAVPVSGNGAYQSDQFTPTLIGTYRWIASYSGDTNNAAVAGRCNADNESVNVLRGTVTPTLSTDASDDITLGGQVNDVATLGGGQNPTGTITFDLYGPNDADCTGDPVFTSTVPVTGAGTYPSGRFPPTQPGTYRWIASYSGDENNAGVTLSCNAPNELVVVRAEGPVTPTLTTVASRDTYVGKEIFDTATLAGGAAPTGSITFELYGPGDKTCSRTPVFTTTVDVDGNGRYRSDAFRPRVPGTYQWVASYSGDDGNEAVRTSCDDEDERVVVKKKKPYGGKPRP